MGYGLTTGRLTREQLPAKPDAPAEHDGWLVRVDRLLRDTGVLEVAEAWQRTNAVVYRCPWWCTTPHQGLAVPFADMGITHRRVVSETRFICDIDGYPETTLTVAIEAVQEVASTEPTRLCVSWTGEMGSLNLSLADTDTLGEMIAAGRAQLAGISTLEAGAQVDAEQDAVAMAAGA